MQVEREECEEDHVWEEGCSVCTCRVNGVVFCRRDLTCRRRHLPRHSYRLHDGIDHYLPGFAQPYQGGVPVAAPALLPPAPTDHGPRDGSTARSSRAECLPGTRWRDGCKVCRCSDTARAVCSRSRCNNEEEEEEERKEPGKEEKHHDHHSHNSKNEDKEHGEESKHDEDKEASQKHRNKHRNQRPHHPNNEARERPVTMKPFHNRGPRGPMMVAPGRPDSIFRPPAYSFRKGQQGAVGLKYPCGRFKVGARYWDDCNLCLCTSRGPKCQGKLCR